MPGTYFDELKAFRTQGGAAMLTPTAGMLYQACLGIWNDQRRPEWTRTRNETLREQSGIDEDRTYRRARAKLAETHLIKWSESRHGMTAISYQILGFDKARSDIEGVKMSEGSDIEGVKMSDLNSENQIVNDVKLSTSDYASRARKRRDRVKTPIPPTGDSSPDGDGCDTLFTIEEDPIPKPDPEQGFKEFWEAYPRKVGKKPALQMWVRSAKRRPAMKQLLSAVAKQAESDQWLRGYIPHPATWLNQERWEDDPTALAKGGPMAHGERGEMIAL